MVGAALWRGLLAGLLAGLVAGLLASIIGEPSVEAAIALEEGSHEHSSAGLEIGRGTQRIGLVVGTSLVGLAVGALFGGVSVWAVGRVTGGGWQRSLKLGATALGALVLLPAVKYPPNPPAVGDPDTIGLRTALYLGLGALGLLVAVAAWAAARRLAGSTLSQPVRQTLVGAGVVAVVVALLVAMPSPSVAIGVPADLLWSFRLASIATQATLFGGTAVVFGLLVTRAERAERESAG